MAYSRPVQKSSLLGINANLILSGRYRRNLTIFRLFFLGSIFNAQIRRVPYILPPHHRGNWCSLVAMLIPFVSLVLIFNSTNFAMKPFDCTKNRGRSWCGGRALPAIFIKFAMCECPLAVTTSVNWSPGPLNCPQRTGWWVLLRWYANIRRRRRKYRVSVYSLNSCKITFLVVKEENYLVWKIFNLIRRQRKISLMPDLLENLIFEWVY